MDTDRQRILQRAHLLPFCISLTALTSEYCIEVNIVSSRGTSYRWEGFDDFEFHAYRLKGISKKRVALIKEHIMSKTLFISDFNRTQLKRIIPENAKTKELSDMFVDFLELPDDKIETVYCFKNTDTGCIYVSDSPNKISDIINMQYPIDTPWEDLDDDQIEAYLDEYEGTEPEIPFACFD